VCGVYLYVCDVLCVRLRLYFVCVSVVFRSAVRLCGVYMCLCCVCFVVILV